MPTPAQKAAETRKRRGLAAKAAATRSQRTASPAEKVFEVGAEGGSLSISRTKRADGAWEFIALRNETSFDETDHDSERQGPSAKAPGIATFDAALQLLDGYRWEG